jgi:SAM-dependent methyltransferase
VTGLDLSPALVERAKERAAERGLDGDYVVGDVEALRFEEARFDKVSSTVGVHLRAGSRGGRAGNRARHEAGRRLVLVNWTPDGGLGKMFKVMAPYQPAPPPSSPFDWGNEQRVRELLGDAFDLEIEEHVSTLRMPSAEDYWDLFVTSYEPTKTLVEAMATGERTSTATGSLSSRRTTERTARSSIRGNTC